MSEITYYQRNRDKILNRAKEYYKINKELLRGRANSKYRSLSEDEKDIKKQYQKYRCHSWYHYCMILFLYLYIYCYK